MLGDYVYVLTWNRRERWNSWFADSRIPHSAAAAAAHDFKTQVQARKDKPLTKYPSYVYEYGRSCCLSEPISIAETTVAELWLLCVRFAGELCVSVCRNYSMSLCCCCITDRGLSIDILCCLNGGL